MPRDRRTPVSARSLRHRRVNALLLVARIALFTGPQSGLIWRRDKRGLCELANRDGSVSESLNIISLRLTTFGALDIAVHHVDRDRNQPAPAQSRRSRHPPLLGAFDVYNRNGLNWRLVIQNGSRSTRVSVMGHPDGTISAPVAPESHGRCRGLKWGNGETEATLP